MRPVPSITSLLTATKGPLYPRLFPYKQLMDDTRSVKRT